MLHFLQLMSDTRLRLRGPERHSVVSDDEFFRSRIFLSVCFQRISLNSQKGQVLPCVVSLLLKGEAVESMI